VSDTFADRTRPAYGAGRRTRTRELNKTSRFAVSLAVGLGVFGAICGFEQRRLERRSVARIRIPSLRTGDWFYFDQRVDTFVRSHIAEVGAGHVVICLGDSTTYCDGVPQEATWPAVFDQISRLYQGTATRYLNLGCNGTGIGFLGRLFAHLPLRHRLVMFNPRSHCRFAWSPDLDPRQLVKSYRPTGDFLRGEVLLRGFGNEGRLSDLELQINHRLVGRAPWLAFYRERKLRAAPLLAQIPRHSLRPSPVPPPVPTSAPPGKTPPPPQQLP